YVLPCRISVGNNEPSGDAHVDTKLLQDLRLLAVADPHPGIVGQDRQVQAREIGPAEIGLAQLGPIPLGAVERAGQHRGVAEIGVDERGLRELAGAELAVLQEQAGEIGEAQVAPLEGCLGQHRSSRDRLGEGRLVEAHAAKARVRGVEIIEIAALERAGREVALDDLGGVDVAKGEGSSLPLAGIEGGTSAQPCLDQLAARQPHRLERAIAELGAREIRTADARRLEKAALEAPLGEIELVQGDVRSKPHTAELPVARQPCRKLLPGDRVMRCAVHPIILPSGKGSTVHGGEEHIPSRIIGIIGVAPPSGEATVHIIKGAISAPYLKSYAQAHDKAGFDLALVGYTASSAEGFLVAQYAAHHTERLGFLIAHRPGFVAPTLAARKIATFDHLTEGRIAIHIISGASDAEQEGDGDFAPKEERYRRAAEYIGLMNLPWTSERRSDFTGQFYRVRGAKSDVQPLQKPHPLIFFGGSSEGALAMGSKH